MNELIARDVLVGELSLGVEYFKGDVGDSGVFIGNDMPTNDANIWIEPTNEQVDVLVTEEQLVAKGYMTEEQVRTLINEILNGEA